MKNRNKLINTLVIAFILVVGAGAAFAFAPGILDVTGTVNIAIPDYIVWTNVEAGPDFELINPLGWEFGATHTAEIVDARERTNQRIEWTINFSEPGFADITATATNESALHPATITNLTYGWDDDQIVEDFGLSVDVITGSFVGLTLAPEASATVTMSVEWDGTIPLGFEGSDTDEYTFINTFFIEFDYELTP